MKIINKLLKGLAAVAILSLFFACASTDDGVKEVVFDNGDTSTEAADEPEEEQEVTDDNAILVTAEEESTFQIEATAPAARETKKNYTGWISTSTRPVTSVFGDIKLTAYPKKGTFAISVMNANGKAVPVISSTNEYTSTSFYLKAGKKIIKLCDDSNVVSAAKKTATGIKIRYTIDKVAIVIVDFDCFASEEGGLEDTIKITGAILSQSKKKTDFALKVIFDTVLGETDRHHFYSSSDTPVKGEVLYHSMKEEKYFTSKNAKGAMQIILDGADISPIESVALANYTTLNTKKWEADMTTFRSFDTVLSYNNSAVGVYWPAVKLEPDEETSSIFYISLASDGNVPGGAAYIAAKSLPETEEDAEQAEAAEETETKPAQEDAVQNIQAVEETPKVEPKKTEQKKTEPKKNEPKVIEPEPEPVVEEPKPQNVPAIEEKPQTQPKTSSITNDMLTSDYIQKLLDKIENLEEGDPEVNKAEINALNAQLDAILEILNSR